VVVITSPDFIKIHSLFVRSEKKLLMLAWDIGTVGHNKNIIAFTGHSLAETVKWNIQP